MARVTFDFDSDGYINVRGERYSALEIVNDAGQTALDWMLAQENEELRNIANSWGLTPEKDDKTGAKKQEDVVDDPENEGNVDEAVDKSDTGGGLSNEEVTSIQERLNNLFGYKMKNNVVQKDSKGNPIIANQKAAIKITAGVEPKIQADGTVDIPGDVTINLVSDSKSMKSVDNGKFTIKFGKIDGNFICRGVKLSSLEGGPKFVKGTFDCGKNDLTSLVGAPEEVNIFIADQNPKLTSLTGGPKKINGMSDPTKDQRTDIYRVDSCGLTSLDGNGITLFGPGGFNCANNKITSLTGLSTISSVGVTKFNCSKNNLSSLNGIPKPRKDAKSGKPGDFDISHNLSVTTFPPALADFEVNDFKANGLSLTSLSFAPKQVYGNFECTDNKGSTKITNQSIGKDRFKPTGFEEVAGNRIVKIDGEFITSEGLWKDKTYDSNTVFKASQSQTSATFGAGTTSGGVTTYSGTSVGLESGQKVSFTEGIKTFTIGYELGNPAYVPSKTGTGLHGNFVPRLGLKGGIGSYAGFKGNVKGWGEKYKSFINLSFFENYLGGSGSAPGPWGPWSPNGAMIVNGKNYGSKADQQKSRPCYYVVGGKPARSSSGEIFSAKTGSTQEATKTSPVLSSISVAACAASGNWVDGKGQFRSAGYSGFETAPGAKNWPFFGGLTDGTYFAGASVGTGVQQFAPILANHFGKKGKQIKFLDLGDGGGSAMFAVNGQMIIGGGRPLPIILAWS